jgi:hypothetical protein
MEWNSLINMENSDDNNTNTPQIHLNIVKPKPKPKSIPPHMRIIIIGVVMCVIFIVTGDLILHGGAITPFGLGVKSDIVNNPLAGEFQNKTINSPWWSDGHQFCFDPPDVPGTYQVYITPVIPHTTLVAEYGYTNPEGKTVYQSLGKSNDYSPVNTTILYNGIQMACVNIKGNNGFSAHLVIKKANGGDGGREFIPNLSVNYTAYYGAGGGGAVAGSKPMVTYEAGNIVQIK